MKWLRIHGSSPVADLDPATPYRKETSDDGGRTWRYQHESEGEFLNTPR